MFNVFRAMLLNIFQRRCQNFKCFCPLMRPSPTLPTPFVQLAENPREFFFKFKSNNEFLLLHYLPLQFYSKLGLSSVLGLKLKPLSTPFWSNQDETL